MSAGSGEILNQFIFFSSKFEENNLVSKKKICYSDCNVLVIEIVTSFEYTADGVTMAGKFII